MSSLQARYIATETRPGRYTATDALAEWIILDDRTAQLSRMPAVLTEPHRLTAATLTSDHIGARVSFARVGIGEAKARVAGTLTRIDRTVRAKGMPGYRLLVGDETHGPLAPHHEVTILPGLPQGERFDACAPGAI